MQPFWSSIFYAYQVFLLVEYTNMLNSQQALWPPIYLMAIHSKTIVRHPYLHSVEYTLGTSP